MKKIMCSGVKREVRAFGHGKRKERNKKKVTGHRLLGCCYTRVSFNLKSIRGVVSNIIILGPLT